LSQAYLGNRKALSQYNTGLTKAELQVKSFDELQQTLDTRLKGAATEAAATYSGQLAILTENAEQAKEVIGKGLVDAFVILAGDNSLEVATDNMKKFGDQIAYALVGAADLLKKLLDIGKSSKEAFIGANGQTITRRPSAFEELSNYGKKVTDANRPMGTPGAISGKVLAGAAYFAAQKKANAEAEKNAARLRKIEQDRLNTLKKIAAESAKKLALDKASAFLNKANQIFDNERIQLAAAAMSKQTEEDRLRIRLKTEIMDLEEAISEGNVQGAAKFAAMITEDARLLGVLRGNAFSLSSVPDPFAAWLKSLEGALAALLAITNFTPTVVSKYTLSNPIANASLQQGLTAGLPLAEALSGARYAAQGAAAYEAANPGMSAYIPKLAEGGIVNSATLAMIGEAGPEAVVPLSRMGSMGGTYVTVNVSGSVTTERDLVDAITQGIYNNQASGIPINYSTVY
jgi:hypothetical protein